MSKRGALIVLEGCDRVGKSTQSKLIVENLIKIGTKAKHMNFPDRSTTIGSLLDQYLKCGQELDDRAVHLLFSANRWEVASSMEKELKAGSTLVIDRYAFSGVAFTAAKGLPLTWCKSPDAGLPRPDIVLYLTLNAEESKRRGGFGQERYETESIQERVRQCYDQLKQEEWKVVPVDGKSIDNLLGELMPLVKDTIASVGDKHIARLWEELENRT